MPSSTASGSPSPARPDARRPAPSGTAPGVDAGTDDAGTDLGPQLHAMPLELGGVPVVVGDTPRELADVIVDLDYLQVGPSRVLIRIKDRGRLLVTPDRVVLEPLPGITVDDMAYLVYGWAPRFLLMLQGRFGLHASAVDLGPSPLHPHGRAVALAGVVGAGKSTTTVGLLNRGHRLVVDDVVPVDLGGPEATVSGWVRPLHLREDAAQAFGVDLETTPRLQRADRKVVLIPEHVEPGTTLPLAALVFLRPAEEVREPVADLVRGADRIELLRRVSNGFGMASSGGRHESYFRWVTALADAVPVVLIRRPTTGWHLDAVLDLVEASAP